MHDKTHIIKDGKRLLNLASNDYLGINSSGELGRLFLANASKDKLALSASSSRSLGANYEVFNELEEHLKQCFNGKKEVLLFNSGYHLNIGAISALASLKSTLFLIDRQAHASMYDGLRLGEAKFLRFRHNDMAHLDELLSENADKFDRFIILSEALFSMDGDCAPLSELIELKRRYERVYLYIDEAHSVGACGDDGLGLVHKSGLEDEIDFIIFTFGKAIASVGAAMLCKKELKEFFINRARSLIYSTALPPINAAFSLFVFHRLKKMQSARKKLENLSAKLKSKLKQAGVNVLGERHILSIIAGKNEAATSLANRLLEHGYYAPAIRPPTVAPNSARVRLSLNAAIDENELMEIVNAL